MSVTTFDTLKFAQRLEQAGLGREQAVAFAEAQKEALETQLATKGDVQRMERDLLLLRWMSRLQPSLYPGLGLEGLRLAGCVNAGGEPG